MPERLPKPSATVDSLMRSSATVTFSWGFIARTLLKAPTLLPFVMIAPALFTINGGVFSNGVADTLGTSSEILLILTLVVTPVITLTGWRWVAPMRQWYGIVFGLSAITDAAIASLTTTDFAGGPVGRLTGHTFLLVGLIMVTILVPLTVTANRRCQKLLGKYWKLTQRATYVVWGLLIVHLTLLEGFGYKHADGFGILHQRMYQLVAVSIPLVLLRIPDVRRWATDMRKDGRSLEMWLVLTPVIALGLVAFFFIEHEFFFKGIGLFELNPPND